tara:strand:+ start:4847 stop:5299 length:453 start_codon:yes stop_codon:yes gene_type:complete
VKSIQNKTPEIFPTIPDKKYFSIGEVSLLCKVKAHVLRYWENEFHQLKPIKRKGNRRYYKIHDVLLVKQIRSLLYTDGFTISGAKLRLTNDLQQVKILAVHGDSKPIESDKTQPNKFANSDFFSDNKDVENLKIELSEILDILQGSQDNK